MIPEKAFSIFFPSLLKVLHLFFIYLFFASKGWEERRENTMIVFFLKSFFIFIFVFLKICVFIFSTFPFFIPVLFLFIFHHCLSLFSSDEF